jgi:hypothetical protein
LALFPEEEPAERQIQAKMSTPFIIESLFGGKNLARRSIPLQTAFSFEKKSVNSQRIVTTRNTSGLFHTERNSAPHASP